MTHIELSVDPCTKVQEISADSKEAISDGQEEYDAVATYVDDFIYGETDWSIPEHTFAAVQLIEEYRIPKISLDHWLEDGGLDIFRLAVELHRHLLVGAVKMDIGLVSRDSQLLPKFDVTSWETGKEYSDPKFNPEEILSEYRSKMIQKIQYTDNPDKWDSRQEISEEFMGYYRDMNLVNRGAILQNLYDEGYNISESEQYQGHMKNSDLPRHVYGSALWELFNEWLKEEVC